MRNKIIILNLINFYYLLFNNINIYARWKWLLEWVWWTVDDLRTGNVHIDDIAWWLKWMIDIFLSLAGTISVIFVIIWAYYLLFGSLKSDHTKWKDTIVMALTGFAISVLAWFVVKLIFDNFG